MSGPGPHDPPLAAHSLGQTTLAAALVTAAVLVVVAAATAPATAATVASTTVAVLSVQRGRRLLREYARHDDGADDGR